MFLQGKWDLTPYFAIISCRSLAFKANASEMRCGILHAVREQRHTFVPAPDLIILTIVISSLGIH